MRQRYVASKRHTIQVDYDDYLHELAKERRAHGMFHQLPELLPIGDAA